MKQNGGWYNERLLFTVPIWVAITVLVLFISAFMVQDYVRVPTTLTRFGVRSAAPSVELREVPTFVAFQDVYKALEGCEISRVLMTEPGQPAHLYFTNGTQGRVQNPEVFNFPAAQVTCPDLRIVQ